MTIYDEMRAQLQELIDLIEQDVQYTSAVAHGVFVPNQDTAQAHQQRTTRIVELKRMYGLR